LPLAPGNGRFGAYYWFTGGESFHHLLQTMAVTTFRSSYGTYNVTRAVLACQSEVSAEGTTTQNVLIFETTDQTETVSIVGKTLFLQADGHTFEASYDGQRRTSLKPCARKQYARALKQGYSPDIELIY
jgi:hypothetical protein